MQQCVELTQGAPGEYFEEDRPRCCRHRRRPGLPGRRERRQHHRIPLASTPALRLTSVDSYGRTTRWGLITLQRAPENGPEAAYRPSLCLASGAVFISRST